jgi:hypothetical protein
MIFVDVPKHWHFVCSQGGGRNVKVMLDLFGLREARWAIAGNRNSDVSGTRPAIGVSFIRGLAVISQWARSIGGLAEIQLPELRILHRYLDGEPVG